MNEYNKSIEFWDEYFKGIHGYKVDEKFVESEILNKMFKDYINSNSKVLDLGCGSGWGIFEIYLTQKFDLGIGIDMSSNSIRLATECAKLSGYDDKITFVCGNHNVLKDYNKYFDFVFSTNLLDVVPDEITYEIIDAIYNTLKDDGYALICLNPAFTEEEMENKLKMVKKDNYYYKDDILRCNYKSISEWENILSKKFKLIKSEPFNLVKNEPFERRLYLLKK